MSDINDESEALFWDLAAPMIIKREAEEGTMMGFKCLRAKGQFFASLERESKKLIVKLPKTRVTALIESGKAEPFSPNGRTFREWALIPVADKDDWQSLMDEAREFVLQLPAKK